MNGYNEDNKKIKKAENNKIKNKLSVIHQSKTRKFIESQPFDLAIIGQQSYTKEQLDQICNDLSPNVWINPHRSPLGLGNYDINVIMTALEMRNCEAIWFDKRKDPSCINLNTIVGFILNVPSDYKFAFLTLPLQKRHWVALRRINEKYYNLDSKLREPECIGDESALLSYLRAQLETNKRELFVIVEKTMVISEPQRPNWLKHEMIGTIQSNSNGSDFTA